MNNTKTLLAASIAAFSLSANAQVETELYLELATNFLDRGQVSGDVAAVGGIEFSTEFGVFFGVEAISSGFSEVDYVVGWAGDFGDLGVSALYNNINFPGAGNGNFDSEELDLELTYADFGLHMVKGLTNNVNDDYNYIAASYQYGNFGFTYGQEDDGAGKYQHLNVAYSVNEAITATFVLPTKSDATHGSAGNKDVQFVVAYSVPLD